MVAAEVVEVEGVVRLERFDVAEAGVLVLDLFWHKSQPTDFLVARR